MHKPAKSKFSPAAIERLRACGRAQFATPESRRAHGELTRARMAGAAKTTIKPEMARLRDAWSLASPEARRRFLASLYNSSCESCDETAHGIGEAIVR